MGKKVLLAVLVPLTVLTVLALIIQLADPHLHIWNSLWSGLYSIFLPFGEFFVDIFHLIFGAPPGQQILH